MSWACIWKRVWHILWSSNTNPYQSHASHKEHGDSLRWQGNGQCPVLQSIDADNNTQKGGIDFQRDRIQHARPPPSPGLRLIEHRRVTKSCVRVFISLMESIPCPVKISIAAPVENLMHPKMAFNWEWVGLDVSIGWAILGRSRNIKLFSRGVVAH